MNGTLSLAAAPPAGATAAGATAAGATAAGTTGAGATAAGTTGAGTTGAGTTAAGTTGAEGFGGALSIVLAALASTAATTGEQTPSDPGTQDTKGAGAATDLAGVDAASAAEAAPEIFQLPVTPAPAPAAAPALPAPATGTAPDAGLAAAPAAGATPVLHGKTPDTPLQTATPALAPQQEAAVRAHAGTVPPQVTSVSPELRKAGDQAGVSPADAPVTAMPGVTAPGTSPLPAAATPATAFAAVQATQGSAQPAAPVARSAATAPAADNTVYVPGAPTPTSAPAVTAAAPALATALAVPVPPGFAAQLVRPVFTLASAGTGEHTMTVAVHPENLGPVTVQAHISASGVRLELFAASADGREVLRQILPDLKRDLAGAGLNASLDLSAGNQPGGGQDAREQFFHRRAAIAYPGGADTRQSPMNSQTSRAAAGLYGTDGSLDVMA